MQLALNLILIKNCYLLGKGSLHVLFATGEKISLTFRRMRRRVTVVVLSVCLFVFYHTSCYIPRFYVEIEVSIGFWW